MRVLLDTHVLLSALAEPQRLSARAADLIKSPNNAIVVSAASAWEIAIKHRIGKLPGVEPIIDGFTAHLAMRRAEELPVRIAHALVAGSLPVQHKDPFDRMLAAQAMLEGVPLLSNDQALSSFPAVQTLW